MCWTTLSRNLKTDIIQNASDLIIIQYFKGFGFAFVDNAFDVGGASLLNDFITVSGSDHFQDIAG